MSNMNMPAARSPQPAVESTSGRAEDCTHRGDTGDRSGTRVIWRQMIVRGFGPYAEEAVVELTPAANVLVAPNEAGKSTLAAALAAILYGLPATSDPERFGQGRYRHWGQAVRFDGELFLSVDGVEYHLTRQFETHKVSLRQREDDRWRLLIDGVADNPESRRPNPQYRRFLQEMIGLQNRELFEATFYLAQPLPNDVELDAAVQQLLSGTGNRYGQVHTGLETKIKEMTRYYGTALGDKSKGNKDRRLEQIESEIAGLEQMVVSGRLSADGLQAVQQQLQETRQELGRLLERLSHTEALEKAWLQWRTERERHQTALHSYQDLEQACSAAKALALRLSEIETQLGHYGEFRSYGEELTPRFEELERIQHLTKGVEDELRADQLELQAATAHLAKLESDQMESPDVLRSTSITAEHGRLLELLASRKRWRENCQALQTRLERIEAELTELPDFARLSEHPIDILDDLTRWLGQCAAVNERWQERKREIDELDNVCARKYGPLVSATPELLEQAANYSLRRLELTQAEKSASLTYHQLTEDEEAYRAAEQAFVGRFGQATVSIPELLTAVRGRLQLLQAAPTVEARPREHKGRPLLVVGAWLLSLVLGGLAAWLLDGAIGLATAAVISLVIGGGAHWLLTRPAVGALAPSSGNESGRVTAEVDQRLGRQLSRCGLSELTEARSMLEQLARLVEHRPGEERLAALRWEWEQAQARLSSWQALVSPLTDAFADPQAAYEQWRGLDQKRALLRQEMRLLSLQLDCEDLSAWEALGALLRRPYLRETLALLAAHPQSVGELMALAGNASDQWAQLRAQAASWEALDQERRQVKNGLTEATQPGTDGLSMGERWAKEAAGLRQRLAPFDEATSTELLHREIERYRGLAQEIEKRRALAEEQAKRLDGKQRQARELCAEWHEALQPVLPLWQYYGEDLPSLRSRYRTFRSLMQEEAQVKQGLQAALQSRQVESVVELERMKTDQALNLVAIKSRWQALIDQHPGLPSQAEANHGQTVADQYRNLQGELISLREQVDQLRGSEDQLRERQAALQGQSPVNIAAAGDELAGLKRQQSQLRRELQAMGLAYRELKAAIADYEGSYRERLARQTTAYFRQITGDASRSVELSTDFSIEVSTEDGRSLVPRQLSQGARDQLYISLRLAIADLMTDNLTLPLVLDDPFVNCDQERLDRSREAIQKISGGRQVLLLTHQPQMGNWGQKVTVRRQIGRDVSVWRSTADPRQQPLGVETDGEKTPGSC